MGQPRAPRRYDAADHDSWMQPGTTAALLLSSVVWLLWWAASLIVGPIRLAIRRRDDEIADDVWGSGERR